MTKMLKAATFLLVGLAVLAGCSSYDEHIDEGSRLAELKMYEEAVYEFERAVTKDSKRGDAFYHLAKLSLDMENYHNAVRGFGIAISKFTETIRLNPDDDAELYNWRGLSYLGRADTRFSRIMYDDTLIVSGDFAAVRDAENLDRQSAAADFTRAIELSPNDPRFFNNRGLAYDYSFEAISDFTQAIQLDPGYAEAYFNRGEIYGGSSFDRSKAIADYTEAIRLVPNYIEAYTGRMIAYTKSGAFDKALMDVEKMRTLGVDAERLTGMRRYIDTNRSLSR